MKGKYISITNEVKEVATMDEPYRPHVINPAEFEIYIQLRKQYEQHIASLHTYPCSPECKGRFKDGEIIEGELKFKCSSLFPCCFCKNEYDCNKPAYIFHPLSHPLQGEDEDVLWQSVRENMILGWDNDDLKRHFTITRKQ